MEGRRDSIVEYMRLRYQRACGLLRNAQLYAIAAERHRQELEFGDDADGPQIRVPQDLLDAAQRMRAPSFPPFLGHAARSLTHTHEADGGAVGRFCRLL